LAQDLNSAERAETPPGESMDHYAMSVGDVPPALLLMPQSLPPRRHGEVWQEGNPLIRRAARRSGTLSSCASLALSALSEDTDDLERTERTASVEDYQLSANDETWALPCLLGAPQRAELDRPLFKVKNTFIDGFADVEEENPMMGRRRTCPEKFEGGSEEDKAKAKAPAARGAARRQECAQKVRIADEFAGSAEADAEADAEIPPLEARQPQMSMGSSDHEGGVCRPCAWFWRPQGCANGAACRHCHLCLSGEVKNRRKIKRAISQAQNQEE